MPTQNDDPLDEATSWFEPLYANADASGSGVPWAKMKPHAGLAAWLSDQFGEGQRALVVGCGLGDDAEAVAKRGYTTTAFDVAPSAIEIAQQRFPQSQVAYTVADLFNSPAAWQQGFDLVVEIITVQALPPHLQPEAAAHVASFVAPGGTLIVGSLIREPHITPQGPPWPVSRETFTIYQQHLTEHHRRETPLAPGLNHGFIIYQR